MNLAVVIRGSLSIAILSLTSCGPDWSVIRADPGAHAAPILDIHFVSSRDGWSVIFPGLFNSHDGGESWSEQRVAEYFYAMSVDFANARVGWVGGAQIKNELSSAAIYHTVNGGGTWHQQDVELGDEVLDLDFCDPRTGWAIGTHSVARTLSAGTSWSIVLVDDDLDFVGVECVHEGVWLLTSHGIVVWSKDAGQSWQQRAVATGLLTDVEFDAGYGWLVGARGTLLYTEDAGESWESLEFQGDENLYAIVVVDDETWVAGAAGVILRIRDGRRWKKIYAPVQRDLFCIDFPDSETGWVGGERDTLLRFSR